MSRVSAADRLRMRLNREEGLKALDKVVLDHGYVEGEPYSFDDHEYQRELLRDTALRISVRKCSQVGLSELMVQKTLALLAAIPNIRVIFSLPTKEMAMAFSKDRFDGAIEQSDHYTSMVAAGGNSASQKKLGSSILYVIGTHGAKSAISVPAEFVISDEVDFSSETILGKLDSRIRHAKTTDEYGNRGYRYRFSTPTVEGYGGDIDFQKGDQRYYMCKCKHCNNQVLPDYFKDFIVPGFDRPIVEFGRNDAMETRYLTDKAWIKCPSCGKDLWDSLCDPSRREWVAKHPTAHDHSYQVSPWDVPKFNEPKVVIKSIEAYPLRSDYIYFVIGLPYSDAENSFFSDPMHRRRQCTVELWIYGQYIVTAPTFGGMDVGKVCHLTVRARVGDKSHVVWMEKIRNTKENSAVEQVLDRYDFFNMKKLCIDAGPDITLVNLLVRARLGIQAVVYVNNISGTLPIAEVKAGDVINADRTKTLTLLLNEHNSGEIFYPAREDLAAELMDHYKTTKKIRERNSDGDMKERFVRTPGADHWVHSLNYSGIAMLSVDMIMQEAVPGVLPGVRRVRVGSGVVHDRAQGPDKSELAGLFGVGSGAARGGRRR